MTCTNQCGYDAAFVDEVPDEYNCVVCHLVLCQPVQIMSCGHRYCSSCFQQLLSHAQSFDTPFVCPVDRNQVTHKEVFPDRGMERMIGNLKVKCGYFELGCIWVDDLRDLNKHEMNCSYNHSRLGVPLTTGSVTKNDELEAKMEEMLQRLSKCEADLASNDKEIANLKFTINELKEERLKERILMDAQYLEIRKSVTSLQNENKELKIKLAKMEAPEVSNIIGSSMLDSCVETVPEVPPVGKIHHVKHHSSGHYQVDWVIPNFGQLEDAGTDVFSSIFPADIDGYRFRLYIKWSGTEKEKLGVFLQLHRDRNYLGALPAFNHEYTFSAKSRLGKAVAETITQEDIKLFSECFRIPDGSHMAQGLGEVLLTSPYDDYVASDSLTLSCVFSVS